MLISIYIYIYMYMCIYIYIYIYANYISLTVDFSAPLPEDLSQSPSRGYYTYNHNIDIGMIFIISYGF